MYSSYHSNDSLKFDRMNIHLNQQRVTHTLAAATTTSTNNNNNNNKKRNQQKSLTVLSLLLVFVCYSCHSDSKTLHRWLSSSSSNTNNNSQERRKLCMNGETTPYVEIESPTTNEDITATQERIISQLDSPRIPGRQSQPSHITLCQELLHRQELHFNNEPINTQFHVNEDDAVCRDWSTPHLSLMQIFSSQVIHHVAQKYHISYSANCQKDLSQDTTDHLDWTTIQEILPPSGLILDNGIMQEDLITDLCKGCMAQFNAQMEEGPHDPENPNPTWFHPHQTHHCLLYPNTSRPIINEQHETDLSALSEYRASAQSSPFSAVSDTVVDRVQMAATEYKIEKGVPPPIVEQASSSSGSSTMEMDNDSSMLNKIFSSFSSSSSSSSDAQRKLRKLQQESSTLPYGTTIEETNGAIIYLDDDSFEMALKKYAQYIPSTVSTIDILLSPLCTTSTLKNTQKSCLAHGQEIYHYMNTSYPDALVGLEMVTSTAAAFSRLTLVKYLVCPPGTSACLIPALSKQDDTFATVAETEADPSTFHYYDFVKNYQDSLQIADVDSGSVSTTTSGTIQVTQDSLQEGGTARHVDGGTTTTTAEPDTITTTATEMTEGLSLDSFIGEGEYRDGCVELRGRLGSWELDYDYKHLQESGASELHGESNVDVAEERFAPIDSNMGEEASPEARFGAWNEDVNPECALDMLNLNGLCEIIYSMGLSVLQFVGDSYTEEQVKSFWNLIGMENPDDAGAELVDGQELDPKQYRRTAHCPREGIAFDIVFTPNEYLVQTVDVPGPIVVHNPETRYVPVPAPTEPAVIQHITNNYNYDQSTTANDYSTATSTSSSNYYQSRTDNTSNTDTSNWSSNPYGGYGGYGGYSGYGGYGGYGGWGYGGGGMMGFMPVYSAVCCCVPFHDQYQHYANGGATGGGGTYPTSGGTRMVNDTGGTGRQAIIGGVTPDTDLDTYMNSINEFTEAITDYGAENDIVVLRSTFETNNDQASPSHFRRRMNADALPKMDKEELKQANRFLIKSVDEYRRRTRQMDMLGNSPEKSGLPSIHVLDVSHMSNSHPHSKHIPHGRRNEQVASLYDHWNHLLYSNLRDIAMAERKRKMQKQHLIDTAPEGSPYHNGVETFQAQHL